MFIIGFFSGCKESPRRPVQRISGSPVDIDGVSKSIERLTHGAPSDTSPSPSGIRDIRVVDISSKLEASEGFLFHDTPPAALSHFRTDDRQMAVRVMMQIRGVPKSLRDSFDERIWELLGAHAPQPWDLRRSRTMDRHEKPAARLKVDFRRHVERVRRMTKNAPQRMLFRFDVTLSFSGLHELESSWQNWTFHWEDEALASAEKVVQEQFWNAFEAAIPVLTAIDADRTSQWILAQGLSPKILRNDLKSLRVSGHRYYANGCLLSREPSANGERYILRSLHFPYAPPQAIDIGMIEDMRCTREAYYILSYESPMRLGMYYQPLASANVWKSMIPLQETIQPGGGHLYMDDDVICAWPVGRQGQSRFFEVHCLDCRTGIPRWNTSPVSGSFRGFAQDDGQLVFVTDQAIAALSRSGDVLDAERIETHTRRRAVQYCQLRNRLIFTRAPGAFVAYNLDEHIFDWQYSAMESHFIHCSQENTFIISESGGYLLAMDVEREKPMWKYRTSSVPHDALTYGGIVYLLLDRAIIALDAETGHRVAQIPLPWRATEFIRLGGDVYINTPEGVYRWSE